MLMKNILYLKEVNMLLPLFLSFIIALSFPIDPLFTSNQNIYLLKGIAETENSSLVYDWMANQTDPFPLFTWLTSASFKISPVLLYIYHIVLSIILIFSLYLSSQKILNTTYNSVSTVFFFLLLFLASNFFEVLNGVAGQYILGSYFQPSTFGVFLILSITLFCFEKYYLAIIFLLIPSYFHPTYIIQAAFLTLTYQVVIFKKNEIILALLIGIFALIAIMPLVYFLYITFESLPLDTLKISKEILAYERMSHHTLYSSWIFRNHTLLGFVLLSSAIIIFRDNKNLLYLLIIPFTLSSIFVIYANLAENTTMLLLFGQRVSVWLMPLAACLMLARLVYSIEWHKLFNLSQQLLLFLGIFSSLVFAYFGINKTIKFHNVKSTNQLHSFLSSLEYANGILLVPLNRENIRLNAKVPIFIDWKSHPYRANEVIEWRERISLVSSFYDPHSTDKQRIQTFNQIDSRQSISFIITDINFPIKNCIPIFKDSNNMLYSVKNCLK